VNVKQVLPHISGRTIDDIVDYLTYSFVPLLLVWRMGWMPGPGGLWVALALIASLFGFSNVSAKQEDDGFFLGFPSYWNIFAYYAGPWFHHHGPWLVGGVLIALTVLTVLPVRFIYPNLAPRPWRGALLVGAAIWMAALLAMLPWYPAIPAWAVWASWVYPAFYIVLSVLLDVRGRRTARAAASGLADPAGDIGG
jgi:phosphatidylcholine synthase